MLHYKYELCMNNHSAVVALLPLRFGELASILDSSIIWLEVIGKNCAHCIASH